MDSTTSSTGIHWSRLFGSQPRVAPEDKKIEARPHRPLGTNIASLVRDLARMGDLQLQLLTLDIQQFWSSARAGLIVGLLASMGILGSLPVLLFGLAGLLERVSGWSPEICRLAIGTVMTVSGAVLVWTAVVRIGRAAECLKRSKDELTQNLKWVREVLYQDQE